MSSIILAGNPDSNLFDWFHGEVKRAALRLGVQLPEGVVLYLIELLSKHALVVEDDSKTLAQMHASAALGPPSHVVRRYQALGDRSLVRAGYFRESLERPRRAVNLNYYCAMGAAAYDQVDLATKRWFSDAFDGIFHELAVRFRLCVELIQEVREPKKVDHDQVLEWYALWMESGDEELAQKLRAAGLVLLNVHLDC